MKKYAIFFLLINQYLSVNSQVIVELISPNSIKQDIQNYLTQSPVI